VMVLALAPVMVAGGEKGTSASECDENQVAVRRGEDWGMGRGAQVKEEDGKRKERMDWYRWRRMDARAKGQEDGLMD
jgi:hypothetical protein